MEIKEIRPIDIARRLRTESNESFFSWVKLVIALSSSFLSVLIAFKSNYVPSNPQYLFLLSLGYISFLVTIVSGLIILHSETQTKLDSANRIEKIITIHGEQAAVDDINNRNGKSIARPIYYWAQYVFHISFGLSLSFIVSFVLSNL
ncbi:MAG: hypothetical protein GQ532_02100 [Methylomarinum sp.]|nr:hypothetical protein [Methylomarinum sp.]